jgi:hypothetical protein
MTQNNFKDLWLNYLKSHLTYNSFDSKQVNIQNEKNFRFERETNMYGKIIINDKYGFLTIHFQNKKVLNEFISLSGIQRLEIKRDQADLDNVSFPIVAQSNNKDSTEAIKKLKEQIVRHAQPIYKSILIGSRIYVNSNASLSFYDHESTAEISQQVILDRVSALIFVLTTLSQVK